jgi:hypothetical protein
MFQYGVLEVDKEDPTKIKIVEEPLDGLDTALDQYYWARSQHPDKDFKLVRIEYKVMEVIDQ